MLKGGRVEGRADPVETGLLKGRNALFAIRNEETAEAPCDWLEWHKTLHGADAALVYCGSTHNDLDVLERLLEPFASAMTFVLVQGDVAHSGENQRIVRASSRALSGRGAGGGLAVYWRSDFYREVRSRIRPRRWAEWSGTASGGDRGVSMAPSAGQTGATRGSYLHALWRGQAADELVCRR